MNPIEFALRHPITILMILVALVVGGGLAGLRMRIDIFPVDTSEELRRTPTDQTLSSGLCIRTRILCGEATRRLPGRT